MKKDGPTFLHKCTSASSTVNPTVCVHTQLTILNIRTHTVPDLLCKSEFTLQPKKQFISTHYLKTKQRGATSVGRWVLVPRSGYRLVTCEDRIKGKTFLGFLLPRLRYVVIGTNRICGISIISTFVS